MKFLTIVLFACACGDVPTTVSELDGGSTPQALGEDSPDNAPGPPGTLPFGYYQRQCQWDACGGPLPDRTAPLVNPNPEK